METKICSRCKKEQPIVNFAKKKDKYSYYCKSCNKEYMEEYYNKNKNKADFIEKRRKYSETYIRPSESIKKHIESTKKWRKNNKEHIREYVKNYDNEHREEKRERDRNWRKNNKDKVRLSQQKDYKKRMGNPLKKLELQLRNMLNMSFKRKKYTKNKLLEDIVGLSSKDMVVYLLQTFKNNYGYDWDNIEPVHIDHIKPLKECTNEQDVFNYCHYTNLQLLKAEDNLSKGSKIDWVLER